MSMKKGMLIGWMAFVAGCAGMSPRAQASNGVSERWHGFMLRNGLQVPIAVELAEASADWSGRLRVGNSSLSLEHVRVTGLGVHFELPGEAAFDGTVAGNWMAGSVSGSAATGSFALVREAEEPFADPITSSGP
jgi:hypothetical protein